MVSEELKKIRLDLIAGDSSFLGKQYAEHRLGCIKLLTTKRNCSESEAEDIFSEAILLLRKKIIDNKLEHLNNLRSYLLNVVVLIHKDLKSNKERNSKKIDDVRALYYNQGIDHPGIETYNIESMKRICSLALRSLSDKCEQILRLYYLEEMRMSDIAELLGFSGANVAKSTKARCYKQWMTEAHKLKLKML